MGNKILVERYPKNKKDGRVFPSIFEYFLLNALVVAHKLRHKRDVFVYQP